MKTIPLTQGKIALVDDDLFDELNKFKWCAHQNRKSIYAKRGGPNGATILMHREVFRLRGLSIPKTIDHCDHNGLNNQSSNLRPATNQEQSRNQRRRCTNESGFIGVNFERPRGKWRASASANGRRTFLGYHETALEAALAHDDFVRANHGEFAVLNFEVDPQ